MGDRTHVALTLDREAYERVKNEPWFDQPNQVEELGAPTPAMSRHTRSLTPPGDIQVVLDYEEVNYGELPCLAILAEKGIAYTSEWGSGDNYGAGESTCRFNANGDIQMMNLPECDANPPLSELMRLIDVPGQMVQYVVRYHDTHTPWPFKNQAEYGRIYQTTRLLMPNKD